MHCAVVSFISNVTTLSGPLSLEFVFIIVYLEVDFENLSIGEPGSAGGTLAIAGLDLRVNALLAEEVTARRQDHLLSVLLASGAEDLTLQLVPFMLKELDLALRTEG